jgi:glycosyltransferase involved in cell wall biosynthesis
LSLMKLLYVCDLDQGGIAKYAQHQLAALVSKGAEVLLVCRPSFPSVHPGVNRLNRLPQSPRRSPSRLVRALNYVRDARAQALEIVRLAQKESPDVILFACYREYFAPLWFGPLLREARRGRVFATIAHDPIRDFVLGPRWWHRLSVRCGYHFIRHVFVHDHTPIDFGGPPPPGIQVHVIPHGPYSLPSASQNREAIRSRFGFSPQDHVFLAFGQIRDGKNLDLFLQAMVNLPERVKLLVAGAGGAASQKPPEYYRQLAKQLGLTRRCHWEIRYIPEEEVADIFAASDTVLLTYSTHFRSASGVLNTAVTSRTPVFASSGPGPLENSVKKFSLGIWVPPDDAEAMRQGVLQLLQSPPSPQWQAYEQEHNWSQNAALVLRALSPSTDE